MKRIFLLLIGISCSFMLQGQIVINEFMAANTKSLQDENKEYNDWIELYNASENSVILDNYYLTDNFNEKLKFALPSGIKMNPKSFLIIFADDKTQQGILHANFKLSANGEEIGIYKLTSNDTLVIDTLTFGQQTNDVSYGRYPDGNNYFEFFQTSTPGSKNSSGNYIGVAPDPVFSIKGGFYSGQQTISLSTSLQGATIHYTTDGSEPTTSSPAYSTPVISDTTFILKAVVYATNYLPGKTIGNTYFIDEHFNNFPIDKRLPVVSISCNKEFLYGSKGILTDYSNDVEEAANIEVFETDGRNVINQYGGIKVFGNATRMLAQKSLAAFARSDYGKGSFDYKFFDDKPFNKYESFVMRDCGNDWSLTYFRDALCQTLVRKPLQIDSQGSKHAILYLNGKFYGIVDLKEKVNEHFVEMNDNANPDNIDMLMDDATLITGSNDNYLNYKSYIANSDLSNSDIYNQIGRMMDIKGYMNLQIAQIYIANIDMFLNQKYWRDKGVFGKWRWIMYDTELSFGQGDYSYANDYGTIPSSNTLAFATENYGNSGWPYLRNWSSEKIISLLNNQNFRNEFIQTFAAHINTTFKKENVLSLIDSFVNRVSTEIPMQIQTYGGQRVAFNPYGFHFTTMEEWKNNVDTMRYFARLRPDYMRSFILDRFGLSGTYNLTTHVDTISHGQVLVQDVPVSADSAGIYFDNVPLRIKAVAKAGYKFLKWEGLANINSTDDEISVTRNGDASLTAFFTPEAEVMFSEILYHPSSELNSQFIEIHNPKRSTSVNLSGYTLTGDISYTFPDSTFISSMGYIVVAFNSSLLSNSAFKVYQWTSGNLNDSLGSIILKTKTGNTVDSVDYSDSNPWPQISENHSIELISDDADNNLGSNWKESETSGGNPGAPVFTESITAIKINEIMANNKTVIADNYYEYNDWIELHNTSNDTINIGGLFITYNLTNAGLFQIPLDQPEETTMYPGEYKLLWADKDLKQGPLHIGFKLNGSGGEVGLSTDGKTVFESVNYNKQSEDVSYGRYPDASNNWQLFPVSTPGFRNVVSPIFTSDPVVSCSANETYNYKVSVQGDNPEKLILGVFEKPNWLKFQLTNPDSAILSGTMPANSTKSYNVKLFLTDGFTNPVIQSFSIVKTIPALVNNTSSNHGFICYPNPTEGIVNIEASTNNSSVQLKIVNIVGQEILTKKITPLNGVIQEQLDLGNKKPGMYYVTIITNEHAFSQKLILK
jgi:hypothetical protein